MKSLTARMFMSLAVIGIAALLLAAAIFVGGHAVALANGAHDDLLLVALALGGAAASMANSFGRKDATVAKRTAHSRSDAQSTVVSVKASAIKLGA
ncbi:MAG: hypothetical protein ABR577_01005 [Pyrinomonadaceae bacterium]